MCSAATVGARVAPVELLEVELFRGELWARRGARRRRAQIALIGGIAAPFAHAAPEAARPAGQARLSPGQRKGYFDLRGDGAHQSSPCAPPENPSAHSVRTNEPSWSLR